MAVVEFATMEIPPQTPPDLNIPGSSNTVRVRAIDATTRMVCDAQSFVRPVLQHHEKLNFQTMCFLLEHETPHGMEYVIYDCGARKDLDNSCPQTRKMLEEHVPAVEVEFGVDEILVQGGLELSQISEGFAGWFPPRSTNNNFLKESVVWSHWHWDHIGDGSKFPSTTDIVVGPGFSENFIPGWPTNPNAFVLASDLE